MWSTSPLTTSLELFPSLSQSKVSVRSLFLKVLTILTGPEKMETCPWMEALVAVGQQDCLSGFGRRRNSLSSIGSIYDNVPETPGSPCDIFDPGKEKAFQNLDDILQHVHGLQHNINEWSRSLGIQPQDQSNEETESMADTLPCSLNYDEQSMSDVGTTVSDYDSPGNSVNEEEEGMRERRDSGVGASLTRPSKVSKTGG